MAAPCDTPSRILDAAERLFADRGIAATSLREITREAGVNLAAVNYHFGSKDGLIRELVRRRFSAVNEARLEALARLEAEYSPAPIPIEKLVRAFLEPAMRHFGEEDSAFPRFVGRLHLDPYPGMLQELRGAFLPVLERFLGPLQRVLPEVPRPVLFLRTFLMMGSLIHLLSNLRKHAEIFPACADALRDPDRILDELVGFAAAGLRHD
ncbi:MAG: TetR/AcrR family transcriptional regulator [Planctomycetota bacterium]|nr:MAG: TetR/AcrR family transcriptional regulator [Planctomycetota bacterium]